MPYFGRGHKDGYAVCVGRGNVGGQRYARSRTGEKIKSDMCDMWMPKMMGGGRVRTARRGFVVNSGSREQALGMSLVWKMEDGKWWHLSLWGKP